MFKKSLSKSLIAFGFLSAVFSSEVAFSQALNKKTASDKAENANFPDRKKDQWAVGLHVGNLNVTGDVKSKNPSLGYALDVRKSFGHTFSLRGYALLGNATGRDLRTTGSIRSLYKTNPALTKYIAANRLFVYNYKTNIKDFSLQGVISLNNLNFYRKSSKWNLYMFAGMGAMTYNTKVDALDASGNIYDFSGVDFNNLSQKEIKSKLADVFDGTYESEGPSFTRDYNEIEWNLTARLGTGLQYKLGKNYAVGLEYSFTRTSDDYLDTRAFTSAPDNTLTNTKDFDNYTFVNATFEYRLGKAQTSLWWENPLEPAYKELAESKEKIKNITADDDKDGVPNHLDAEPFSPDAKNVNEKGESINKLVVDKNAPVDTNNLLDPRNPKSIYYGAGNGGDDSYDEGDAGDNTGGDNAGGNNTGGNNSGKGGKGGFGKGTVCNPTNLPMVHFDLNRFYIKPEFNAALHEVAMMMIACPSIKMVVTGHTDNRENAEYNKKLSYNRATKVTDYIVSKYGINADRFMVKFDGESAPMVPGLPDSWSPKYDFRQYLNRRVEFRIAKPGETGSAKPAAPNKMNAGKDY
jgi:outer membrane protein OmpA-like peptidoglycan-associated protein/opacity protein-like surface antigen